MHSNHGWYTGVSSCKMLPTKKPLTLGLIASINLPKNEILHHYMQK